MACSQHLDHCRKGLSAASLQSITADCLQDSLTAQCVSTGQASYISTQPMYPTAACGTTKQLAPAQLARLQAVKLPCQHTEGKCAQRSSSHAPFTLTSCSGSAVSDLLQHPLHTHSAELGTHFPGDACRLCHCQACHRAQHWTAVCSEDHDAAACRGGARRQQKHQVNPDAAQSFIDSLSSFWISTTHLGNAGLHAVCLPGSHFLGKQAGSRVPVSTGNKLAGSS